MRYQRTLRAYTELLIKLVWFDNLNFVRPIFTFSTINSWRVFCYCYAHNQIPPPWLYTLRRHFWSWIKNWNRISCGLELMYLLWRVFASYECHPHGAICGQPLSPRPSEGRYPYIPSNEKVRESPQGVSNIQSVLSHRSVIAISLQLAISSHR